MKPGPLLRDEILNLAKDGKERTAAEIAEIFKLKTPGQATQVLTALKTALVYERSEWRLRKTRPESGRRVLRWRLELRIKP
jgi:hypothetical protein